MPKTLDFPRFFLKQAMKFMNFMPVFVARIKFLDFLHYIYNIKGRKLFFLKIPSSLPLYYIMILCYTFYKNKEQATKYLLLLNISIKELSETIGITFSENATWSNSRNDAIGKSHLNAGYIVSISQDKKALTFTYNNEKANAILGGKGMIVLNNM